MSSQEALPNRRKTALRSGASQMGRNVSNIPGRRCTSSMITNPSQPRSSRSGVADTASRMAATSKSKTWDGPRQADATCPAKVVLPTCRAPRSATTGTSESPSTAADKRSSRAIFCCISAFVS